MNGQMVVSAHSAASEHQGPKAVMFLPLRRHSALTVPAAWEVPMEYAALIIAIVFVLVAQQAVRGRLWQRRHTYMEEFWHSNGW
jgi:hypothetical protein